MIALNIPASNSTGTASDVSALGTSKTFTFGGTLGTGETLIVEGTADPTAAAGWNGIVSINSLQPDGLIFADCVVNFMRVRRSSPTTSTATPTASVDGGTGNNNFVALNVPPAGNANGTPTNISAFGTVLQFTIGGTFAPGEQIIIEVSVDGTTFDRLLTYTSAQPPLIVSRGRFNSVRVRRQNTIAQGSGVIVVFLGVAADSSGADINNPFVVYTTPIGLPSAQNIGLLATGVMQQTTAAASATISSVALPAGRVPAGLASGTGLLRNDAFLDYEETAVNADPTFKVGSHNAFAQRTNIGTAELVYGNRAGVTTVVRVQQNYTAGVFGQSGVQLFAGPDTGPNNWNVGQMMGGQVAGGQRYGSLDFSTGYNSNDANAQYCGSFQSGGLRVDGPLFIDTVFAIDPGTFGDLRRLNMLRMVQGNGGLVPLAPSNAGYLGYDITLGCFVFSENNYGVRSGWMDHKLFTPGGNVQNFDITSLNGDLDGDYVLEGEIDCSAAVQDITLQPNALATNQQTISNVTDLAHTTNVNFANLYVGSADDASSAKINFRIWFQSKSGRDRLYLCRTFVRQTAGNYVLFSNGLWTGTATNITSLRLHSTVAGGITSTSYCRLTRVRNHT